MENLKSRAIERFNRLWENEGGKLLRSSIIPVVMKNGEIHPTDYCISTIARLINQPNGNEIVSGIRSVLSNLFKVADKQFIYLDESLHISLLGCTQRQETDVFDDAQISKIKDICIQEIKKKEPSEINLKGVGIVGNQIFIQGIQMNRNWEELRTSLDKRLVNSGEHPISYEDKTPIHINIIQIVNSNPDLLASLHKVISQLRDVDLGTIKLTTIEFVITDFCVSKKNVVWLDKIECCESPTSSKR
jgi:2'-5' RNA ligase